MKSIGLVGILGSLLVTGCSEDDLARRARVCSTPGTTCVWAGITGERGFNNENLDANRLESNLYFPEDLTFGPDGRAYIVDWNNHRIRRVETNDSLTTVMGTDYEGDGPPEMEDRLPVCNPVGALGTTVALNHPTDAEFGPDGKLYVAAWHNNKIRVLDPDTLMTTTLAGNGYGYAGDGGPACQALFNQPKAVTIAPDGTVYTIDQRNVRIRAVTPGATGMIDTVAGTGTVGNVGDGGPAIAAEFGFDTGTTPRASGSLLLSGRTMYVADSLNHRIRRIDLDTGLIDCIAGNDAIAGYSGDGGPAMQAHLNFPNDLELGPDGRLYVADEDNSVIRAIDLTTNIIETVAGTGTRCDATRETCDSELPAREVGLNQPYGIAFDAAGNLYIADTHNHQIMKVAR